MHGMTSPPPDGVQLEIPPPPPPVRQPFGWIALALVFALLIGSSLAMYFTGEQKPSDPYRNQVRALEFAVLGKDLQALTEDSSKDRDRVEGAFDDIVNEVADQRTSDPKAAWIYAAARTELGRELKPEDIAILRADKDEQLKAVSAIYQAKTLKPEEARELAMKIESDDFLATLTKVHAHEKAGNEAMRKELIPPQKMYVLVAFALLGTGAAAVGLVLWLVYVIRRNTGAWLPGGFPLALPNLVDADRAAVRSVLLILAWQLIPAALLAFLPSGLLPQMMRHVVVGMLGAIGFLLVLRMPIWGIASSLREVVGSLRPLKQKIAWSLGAYIAQVPLLGLAVAMSVALSRLLPEPSHPMTEELAKSRDPGTLALIIVGACILAPFLEEILFRGMLLPAIARVTGSATTGILVSSFLFAAIHPQGIAGWPPLFVVGMMTALVTWQTKSLLPAMILHAIHNGVTLALGLAFL